MTPHTHAPSTPHLLLQNAMVRRPCCTHSASSRESSTIGLLRRASSPSSPASSPSHPWQLPPPAAPPPATPCSASSAATASRHCSTPGSCRRRSSASLSAAAAAAAAVPFPAISCTADAAPTARRRMTGRRGAQLPGWCIAGCSSLPLLMLPPTEAMAAAASATSLCSARDRRRVLSLPCCSRCSRCCCCCTTWVGPACCCFVPPPGCCSPRFGCCELATSCCCRRATFFAASRSASDATSALPLPAPPAGPAAFGIWIRRDDGRERTCPRLYFCTVYFCTLSTQHHSAQPSCPAHLHAAPGCLPAPAAAAQLAPGAASRCHGHAPQSRSCGPGSRPAEGAAGVEGRRICRRRAPAAAGGCGRLRACGDAGRAAQHTQRGAPAAAAGST